MDKKGGERPPGEQTQTSPGGEENFKPGRCNGGAGARKYPATLKQEGRERVSL